LPISYDFSKQLLSNLTQIRNEINRLRIKHSLSSVSFPDATAYVLSGSMVNAKNEIKNIEQSQWITTIDVSNINAIDVGNLIKAAEFNNMKTKLEQIDLICPHYSNYGDYGDDGYDPCSGYDGNYTCPNQSVDAHYPSDGSYNSPNSGCNPDCGFNGGWQ